MFDRFLIQKAKTNPFAFTRLYRQHVSSTYRYIMSRCKNHALAEDLTSMVWEKVLNNIQKLKSNDSISFKAWLFTIIKNTISEYYRKTGQSKTIPFDEDLSVFSETKIPEKLSLDEQNHQLQKIMEALPKQQKQIIQLRFAAELKNKEIAKILNIHEKTVASQLTRALKTLRSRLEKL